MNLEFLHDKHAERWVLGSVLQRPDALDEVEFLSPDDFWASKHRMIFDAMLHMRERHDVIDYISVESYLQAHGVKDVEVAEIGALTDGVASATVLGYARKVQDRSRARRMHLHLNELVDRLERGEKPGEIGQELLEAAELGGEDKIQLSTISEAADRLEAYQCGKSQAYTLTGMDALDKYPAASNELVIMAGRPSMGKTALGVCMADRMSMRGLPVSFLSIEMAGPDIHFRRIAAQARVPMTRLKQPNGLTDGDWARTSDAIGRMHKAPVEIMSGRFGLADIVVAIRQARAKRGIVAAFVDHLACMPLPRADRHDLALGKVTSTLARLAKDLSVTIYLLHQLNRGTEQRENKRPTLADLRNSGEIEQDADAVWLLYRDSYYGGAGNEFEINVAKNRNGPVGVMHVEFDAETGRFEERIS